MPVTTYTTTCLSNEKIARNIWEFRLEKPAGFSFQPGQYVLFNVGLIENPTDVQTRAFSIASAPQENDLLFVARMNPGGRASRWIEEQLREGSTVSMKTIFGRFLLDRGNPKERVYIATSTGIAPFRSFILDSLAAGDRVRTDLVYGVRSEEDLFWADELREIAQKNESLFLHLAMSQPSDNWTDHRGRVQTLVPQIVGDFAAKAVYVCGSPEMTKDVKQTALEQWGVQKQDLHVEGYI